MFFFYQNHFLFFNVDYGIEQMFIDHCYLFYETFDRCTDSGSNIRTSSNSAFLSTNNNLIKGQIISRKFNSHQPILTKISKQQVVGLITLESCENSLEKWSQLLQRTSFLSFLFFQFRYSNRNQQRTSNSSRNDCCCQISRKAFFFRKK